MKTEKNIFIAFILNLAFSIFEFIGGIFTSSVAIISDAIHDIGDAISIGFALFFEKKSKKQPDEQYTYGYSRYSVVGSVLTILILVLGSITVIYNAVLRIITPIAINYNGMIIFAFIGVFVNIGAWLFTKDGYSFNQKAVNLHLLEDTFGWIIVLVGAIVIKFTDFYIIDPLMSVGVAIFILLNALKNLKEILYLFLEKTPHDIRIDEIREHICKVEGVFNVHHIHVWSIDGHSNYATMHVVAKGDAHNIKEMIRDELKEYGIIHVTLELEGENEHCQEEHCHVDIVSSDAYHYH